MRHQREQIRQEKLHLIQQKERAQASLSPHHSPNLLLRRARQARGWSQKEVADRLEAPYTFMVSRWENGIVFPGPGYREKLCTLFQMSREELGLVRRTTGQSRRSESALQRDPLEGPLFDLTIPQHRSHGLRIIGREALMQDIIERLLHGTDQCLALQGLPGIGKTTLAAALSSLSDLQKSFADGVLWAGLGPRPNVLAIFSHWSVLLGIESAKTSSLSTYDAWARTLRDAIGMRQLLLIIDDAWTIEDALSCLVGGPQCVYLLTSRQPEVALHFAGPHIFQVPALGTLEGRELLIQYASCLKETPDHIVASLVQAVGGLPLALKLIGIHLMIQGRHHQPRRLQAALTRLQEVGERLQLQAPQAGLEHDSRLPGGTPLTLQAIIELSECLLTPTEQQALYMLSVFPPNPQCFSEEAALAVIAGPPEVLDRLVDTGLVEVNDQGRYHLHQTIADYGLSRRTDTQAEQRLVTYITTYVEAHHSDHKELGQELNLILAALNIALNVGREIAFVQGVCHIAHFLFVRGLFSQAEPLLQQAYQIARQHQRQQYLITILDEWGAILRERGAFEQAEALLEQGLGLARQQNDRTLIMMLLRRGTIAEDRCEHELAETLFQEALVRARHIDDAELVCRSFANLASVLLIRGNPAQAEAFLQEALILLRQKHLESQVVIRLSNLGWVQGKQGKFELAEANLREGLVLARTLQMPAALCSLQLHLAWVLQAQDEYYEAVQCLQEALHLAQQLRSWRDILPIRLLQASIGLKRGDVDLTQTLLQAVAKPAYQMNYPEAISLYLQIKGRLELQQGAYRQAQRTLQEGLALTSQFGYCEHRTGMQLLLAATLLNLQELEQAHLLLQEGLDLVSRLSMPHLMGLGLSVRGEYHLLLQEYEEAAASYQTILATVPASYREWHARAHEGLAHVKAGQGRPVQASEHGEAALAIFEAIGHYRTYKVRE